MFENTTDTFIREQVGNNFAFITGMESPIVKTKEKKKQMDKAIPFSELSFIHMAIFMNAFTEGKRRGIFSPAEIAACEEVMAIISPA